MPQLALWLSAATAVLETADVVAALPPSTHLNFVRNIPTILNGRGFPPAVVAPCMRLAGRFAAVKPEVFLTWLARVVYLAEQVPLDGCRLTFDWMWLPFFFFF